jgi:hypothetical protein
MMNAGGACAKRIQGTSVLQGPRGSRRSGRRAKAGLLRRSLTGGGESAGPAGSTGRTDRGLIRLVTCPTPSDQQVVFSSTCPGRTHTFLLPTPTRRGWERPRPGGRCRGRSHPRDPHDRDRHRVPGQGSLRATIHAIWAQKTRPGSLQGRGGPSGQGGSDARGVNRACEPPTGQ